MNLMYAVAVFRDSFDLDSTLLVLIRLSVACFLGAVLGFERQKAQYNLAVQVDVQGQVMTLCQAVKMVGGAGRLEKMWREAATGPQQHFGFAQVMVRQKDQEFAKRSVNAADAVARTTSAAKFANALRNAIALGNSRELGLDVPAELLE